MSFPILSGLLCSGAGLAWLNVRKFVFVNGGNVSEVGELVEVKGSGILQAV